MWKFAMIMLVFLSAGCENKQEEDNSILSKAPFAQLTDSIEQAPGNADLYYRRGVLLYNNMQFRPAEEDVRKAWQLQPREDYGLSMTTLLMQKDMDSAIVFLQSATQKLPESIALQIALARGYQNKRNNTKALSIVNQLLQQYPGQLDALTLKSELLSDDNRKDESLKYLEKAHALAPTDVPLNYNLAYEYALVKNPKALSMSDSLVATKTPEAEKAFYIKATYYALTGNTAAALENFDAAIQTNYNFLDAYRDKGELLFNNKKYESALRTYQLALKVAPASADFFFLVGKTQEAMGDKSSAKQNYQRAFSLDKTMTDAKEAADRL
jgi:tetratricopeptide (TPR) repeat protein